MATRGYTQFAWAIFAASALFWVLRGYLNPLVQENHCKYDQSGWSYKYLETHVFRCAKKKNPKKSFFIIFMGSNLVKMPAQTQLAVLRE